MVYCWRCLLYINLPLMVNNTQNNKKQRKKKRTLPILYWKLWNISPPVSTLILLHSREMHMYVNKGKTPSILKCKALTAHVLCLEDCTATLCGIPNSMQYTFIFYFLILFQCILISSVKKSFQFQWPKQRPHPFSKNPKFRHNRLNSKSPKKQKTKKGGGRRRKVK